MVQFPQTLFLCALMAALPTGVQAATLDVPGEGRTLSGIGVIHGWKCTAGQLTVRFNGGAPLPLLYGAERGDVVRAGGCAQARVGYVSIMNWNLLGDGVHTAVVYDDGQPFARSTFTVVTPGTERYGGGEVCTGPDFPDINLEAKFQWDSSTQHMELVSITGMDDDDLTGVSDTDLTPFDFLFTQPHWMIMLDGVSEWKNISASLDPTRAGDQVVPAPAIVRFMRKPTSRYKNPSDPAFRAPVAGAEIAGRTFGSSVYGGAQKNGYERILALGGVLDMLPEHTAWELGVLDDTYAMVLHVPRDHPTQLDYPDHCYVMVFNHVTRTEAGGLETAAQFAITEKEQSHSIINPGACINPVTPLRPARLRIY